MARRNKAGRAVSSRDRAINTRPARQRILIVCEGEKTEPNYFNSIIRLHKLNTVSLQVVVEGAGRVTRSLVDHAEQRGEQEGFAEVWCVFDKDSFPNADFDNAIAKTNGHKFLRAAWSNEAFEPWYILHFEYLNSKQTRAYYTKRLDKLVAELGRDKYQKNDAALYEALGIGRLMDARRNAKKLLELHDVATPCHDRKPATMVFELVERLLSYAPDNPLGN